jgi:hypothetical protein
MKWSLTESEAARTYPEEVRDRAVAYASNYVFFSLMTYAWLLLGMAVVILIHVAVADFIPDGPRMGLDFFLTLLCWTLIRNHMGRRMLMTRRAKIMRLIHGGYNGPDKNHPGVSA